MTGYLAELQRSLGRALKAIHKTGGFKVRYSLVTDLTTDPIVPVDLDIFIHPISLDQVRKASGGRQIEILNTSRSIFSEKSTVFLISREAIKTGSMYHTPTFHDTFRELNATDIPIGPTFFVDRITSINSKTSGWFLTVTAQFRDHAKG